MLRLLKNNFPFFGPYFLFVIASVAIMLCYDRMNIFMYINRHHYPYADTFFKVWTNIGLGYLIIPVAVGLSFVKARAVIMSLFTYLLAFTVNDSLKYITDKPRPQALLSALHISFYSVPGVQVYSDYSFPSGHTAVGFALFCLLALLTLSKPFKFIAFMVAFLIGYSRMYLAEHFLADVVMGSLIGVISALIVYQWLNDLPALSKFAWMDRPIISL